MPKAIQVAICDHSPTIRHGLQHILNSTPDIEIVAEASTHKEMLSTLADISLDIVITDVDEQGQTEFNFLRRFSDLRPDVKIIIFTAYTERQIILKTIEMGVQGYQLKQADCEDIINAILIVNEGGTSVAPCVTSALLEELQTKYEQSQAKLSKREQQVLDLLAMGKTNSDIADALFISVRTVKFHVSSILLKLNAKNRTEAALKAQ